MACRLLGAGVSRVDGDASKHIIDDLEGHTMKTSQAVTEQTQIEPIALVGIGCRFPGGVHHAESFWDLLKEGRDAIIDVPPDRWNVRRFFDPDAGKPGKMYVKQGGFLKQRVDAFDALFFGIAPREAECIDPL